MNWDPRRAAVGTTFVASTADPIASHTDKSEVVGSVSGAVLLPADLSAYRACSGSSCVWDLVDDFVLGSGVLSMHAC